MTDDEFMAEIPRKTDADDGNLTHRSVIQCRLDGVEVDNTVYGYDVQVGRLTVYRKSAQGRVLAGLAYLDGAVSVLLRNFDTGTEFILDRDGVRKVPS